MKIYMEEKLHIYIYAYTIYVYIKYFSEFPFRLIKKMQNNCLAIAN